MKVQQETGEERAKETMGKPGSLRKEVNRTVRLHPLPEDSHFKALPLQSLQHINKSPLESENRLVRA